LAIHAEIGAGAALDAADHLDLAAIDEGQRRVAPSIVDEERHLGEIALRPIRSAAEDDVIHFAAAHALGRVLAHHPAQRLDEVRLAAAIGPDDAGHAGLDQQLGMVDEGFETGKSKTRDLQLALSLLLAASSSDRPPLAGDCRSPPRSWRGGREGGFEIP